MYSEYVYICEISNISNIFYYAICYVTYFNTALILLLCVYARGHSLSSRIITILLGMILNIISI